MTHAPAPAPWACFVTGTDTGVGKTRVSCALLRALGWRGLRAVGMKPVASGADRHADGRWANDDVLQLRAASSLAVAPELDNPYLLPEPLSPHLAARHAGVRIEIDNLVSDFQALRAQADAVVVEGAGGFIVPLAELEPEQEPEPEPDSEPGSDLALDARRRLLTSADLAVALGLPVVLVVGLRLGCLNHALLTAEAIERRGLRLAGWVANQIDPAMQVPEENVATLRRALGAPLLADWPWVPADGLQADNGDHANWAIDLGPLLGAS